MKMPLTGVDIECSVMPGDLAIIVIILDFTDSHVHNYVDTI